MSDLRLTHIGGPTVLVEVDGWRLLTDPTFDAPGRRYRFGWGTSSRKTTGPALPAGDLGRIDAVLLTHEHHADNLDDTGRSLLPTVPVVVTTVSGAARLGGHARGIRPWETTRLESPDRPPIEITATPCRHGPPLSRLVVGDVIGFALRRVAGRGAHVWISGDTVLYDGVRQVAERFRIDTAILHLGGVRFPITGPVHYSMTAAEAVELCRAIDARVVVPVHYEGWSHFHEGRDAIEDHLLRAAPARVRESVRWAPLGEPLTIDA